MLVQTRLLTIGLILLLAHSSTANAAVWEVLFSAKQDSTEAKIELKTSSLKTRLVRGEKNPLRTSTSLLSGRS